MAEKFIGKTKKKRVFRYEEDVLIDKSGVRIEKNDGSFILNNETLGLSENGSVRVIFSNDAKKTFRKNIDIKKIDIGANIKISGKIDVTLEGSFTCKNFEVRESTVQVKKHFLCDNMTLRNSSFTTLLGGVTSDSLTFLEAARGSLEGAIVVRKDQQNYAEESTGIFVGKDCTVDFRNLINDSVDCDFIIADPLAVLTADNEATQDFINKKRWYKHSKYVPLYEESAPNKFREPGLGNRKAWKDGSTLYKPVQGIPGLRGLGESDRPSYHSSRN